MSYKGLDFYVSHRTAEEFEIEGLQVQLCESHSRIREYLGVCYSMIEDRTGKDLNYTMIPL